MPDEKKIDLEAAQKDISALIQKYGGEAESFEGQLVSQIIETGLKLMAEDHDVGQLKVITRSMKEMRYAYGIFNRYKKGPCISIFGSARTPEDHPDYLAAKEFSIEMGKEGWMCITGAANGIMKASAEGLAKEHSFGLSIRLLFDAPTNSIIQDNPKLILFRYFFTRKLMFMSHSQAIAVFPGGVGTMDELFEMLTLIQTGKANIVPIVLLEGSEGNYWEEWERYIKDNLLKNGWISPEDLHLYRRCTTIDDAVEHIRKFYSNYHSSRYVKDFLIIRTLKKITVEQLALLNSKFKALVSEGAIEARGPFPEEDEHLDLPRIVFRHTGRDIGILRQLIDQINEFEPERVYQD